MIESRTNPARTFTPGTVIAPFSSTLLFFALIALLFGALQCSAIDSAAETDAEDRLVLGIATGTELAKPALPTVSFVDPTRYVGLWYEIASIPQFFNRSCLCTTATYGVVNSTTISVFNQCRLNTVDGSLSTINGTAIVTDPGTNAKLAVSFFGPFVSDYFIIALASDYSYAMVGDRLRGSLFILSRATTLDQTTYNNLLSTAAGLGFDTSRLTLTTQAGCP